MGQIPQQLAFAAKQFLETVLAIPGACMSDKGAQQMPNVVIVNVGQVQTCAFNCPNPYQSSVSKHLSKIPEIDAVFLLTDEDNIVHVYSVTREFQERMYDKLIKQQNRVEQDFPGTIFDFHVRAHQGRQANRAVPFGCEPVFLR